jgi:hypothetical protein
MSKDTDKPEVPNFAKQGGDDWIDHYKLVPLQVRRPARYLPKPTKILTAEEAQREGILKRYTVISDWIEEIEEIERDWQFTAVHQKALGFTKIVDDALANALTNPDFLNKAEEYLEVLEKLKSQSTTTKSPNTNKTNNTNANNTNANNTNANNTNANNTNANNTNANINSTAVNNGSQIVKQKHDEAVDGFKVFLTDPNACWTFAKSKKVEGLKLEMSQLNDAARNNEDDIHLKGILFDSKDEDYGKYVTQVVKVTMGSKTLQGALLDPTNKANDAIAILNKAMEKLAIQRAHYADMKGKTSKEKDQRRRKVDAIDEHILKMKQINAKLREVLKMKMQPALDLLDTLPSLANADPAEGLQAINDFIKQLAKDPKMQQGIFQSAGPEHCEALSMLILNTESKKLDQMKCTEDEKRSALIFGKQLGIMRAADSELMDPLCEMCIVSEARTEKKDTFFRENSPAMQLCTGYVQNSPAGKAYGDKTLAGFKKLTTGKGSLEIDTNRFRDKNGKGLPFDEQGNPAVTGEFTANVKEQARITVSMIDSITADPDGVPPEAAKLCGIFHKAAKDVSGGDDEFATTQSGGFLMLRLVNPKIANAAPNEIKQMRLEHWLSLGKREQDFDEYLVKDEDLKDQAKLKKLREEERLATHQGKILQNISNGITFGAKEKGKLPLNAIIKTKDGAWAKPAAQLRDFLEEVADPKATDKSKK